MANSLSDFLSGSPVPPQPTGSDQSSSFPLWLQTYVYNLSNAASNLAGTPYTQFGGPQVASPSGATQGAWNLAEGNVGAWQPALNAAYGLTEASASPLDPSAIQGYTGALNRATQSGIPGYMNPFTSQVIGGVEGALNQNLFQNVLPSVQDKFVSAGQSRSPQEAQMTAEAIGQNQTALGSTLSPLLEQGYSGALNAATNAANTGVNTATGQQLNQRQAGAQFGVLGGQQNSLGTSDVGLLSATGQAQDQNSQANINAALNNFYAQQQWPYQNLGFASNIIRGLPTTNTPANVQTSGLTFNTNGYNPSPLSAFAGAVAQNQSLGSSGFHFGKGGPVRRRTHKPALAGAFRLAA